MVRGFAVDVDGLTGDQAGDFQAEMHGVSVFDSFSIGHKKAPGEGGCATSGFGYAGDQNAVHMLWVALLVFFPELVCLKVLSGSVDSGEPVALAVPTNLQSPEVFHWAVCLMNLV